MELCFWKNAREAAEIIEGYGTQSATSKQKASFWCEEDEEKLSRVFRQLREMEQNGQGSGDSGDLLDNISAFFIDSGKSRRQVAKKLKDLALIAVRLKRLLRLWVAQLNFIGPGFVSAKF